MSDNATLEIKKFDGKRDLRSEIIRFYIGDSSAISPVMSGNRDPNLKKLSLVLPTGEVEYLAAFWVQDREKIYPEMIIKGKFSPGVNGTQTRAVFTFNQVKVDGYGYDKDNFGESIFMLEIDFEKFTYILDSTASASK